MQNKNKKVTMPQDVEGKPEIKSSHDSEPLMKSQNADKEDLHPSNEEDDSDCL